MAAVVPLRESFQPEKHTQYEPCQPFDAELLCAKLEVAKRDREERENAVRLRRQVRDAFKKGGAAPRCAESTLFSTTTSVIDLNDRSNWYKLPNNSQPLFSIEGGPYESRKKRHRNVHYDIPESEPDHEAAVISPIQDSRNTNNVLLSPDESIHDTESPVQPSKKDKTKRRSFAALRDFALGERDKPQRPGDTAKRRSQTTPLLKTRVKPSRGESTIPHGLSDSPPELETQETVQHSLTGFENEYTISFDTCQEDLDRDHDLTHRPKLLPINSPYWASRSEGSEGMRSLLNLPSMLKRDKKDKTQVVVEEKHDVALHDGPPVRRPHTRSHTAPDALICEAVASIKKEERAKKRRSISGFFQSILLPKHSMSMHGVHVAI